MRLLIVEDEERFAENLKNLLEDQGYAVDLVSDGEKARRRMLLHHRDYDAILVDLQIPSLNGMTLTRSVRDAEIKTPIIILTGQDETASKIALLNAGADDYMVKPFSPLELVARLVAVLRRPSLAQPVTQVVGEITLDASAHRVCLGNKEVKLTLKEYALLQCLMRRPGEVFTREDLSAQVWDFNALTLSNVLDVHMKNLRRKLKGNTQRSQFETVRGVGYRLVA